MKAKVMRRGASQNPYRKPNEGVEYSTKLDRHPGLFGSTLWRWGPPGSWRGHGGEKESREVQGNSIVRGTPHPGPVVIGTVGNPIATLQSYVVPRE